MKWTRAADWYRRLGEGLGLLDPHSPPASDYTPPTPNQVARAEAAFARMRSRSKKLGIAMSDSQIVALVKSGRRS